MRSYAPSILGLVALAAAGQVLIKLGLDRTSVLQLSPAGEAMRSLQSVFTSPPIVAGLLVYVVSSFLWLVVLSRVNLSYAFPFVSLTYVLVLGASAALFDEPLFPSRLVGSALIVAGVIVLGVRG